MVTKKKYVLIVCAAILVLGLGLKHFFLRAPTAPSMPTLPWVQASAVMETTMPLEVRAMGSLTARSVAITPELAGYVKNIHVQDGAMVKAGTVLVQLDDAIYQSKLQSAKARLTYSRNQFKRLSSLVKRGAVTQQAIDQAEADLKEKQAEARECQVMVDKMKLLAPFDGVLGQFDITVGEYIPAGKLAVSITERQHLHVAYALPERYVSMIKLGQSVTVTSVVYPQKQFKAQVAYVAPIINASDRSVAIYANLDNTNDLLAPGMFVDVLQDMGEAQHTIMIPARSLVPVMGGEQVYKMVSGKALGVKVVIGQRRGDLVQILSGLSIGDQIITDGQLKVREGMAVQVQSSLQATAKASQTA